MQDRLVLLHKEGTNGIALAMKHNSPLVSLWLRHSEVCNWGYYPLPVRDPVKISVPANSGHALSFTKDDIISTLKSCEPVVLQHTFHGAIVSFFDEDHRPWLPVSRGCLKIDCRDGIFVCFQIRALSISDSLQRFIDAFSLLGPQRHYARIAWIAAEEKVGWAVVIRRSEYTIRP